MPVLLTTAYPSGQEVFSLVRSLLNDADLVATSLISTVARVSTVVTVTTQSAHQLQIGNLVQVASVSDTSFNGSVQVVAVPTATTFQYVQSGAPDATSANGTVQLLIQGDVFTDNVLLNFANKAYRKVQAALLENGSKTATEETFITLPANTTQLLDTTSPQLPVDFLAPRTIMERQSGSGLAYVGMQPVDELPSFADGTPLTWNRVWAWYLDGIYFPGSTVAMDIRMRYLIALPDISGADGAFTIRGSQDVIADYAAFLAANSRGAPNAGVFLTLYQQDMKQFLNLQNHARNYLPARRRPANAGRRYRTLGNIL